MNRGLIVVQLVIRVLELVRVWEPLRPRVPLIRGSKVLIVPSIWGSGYAKVWIPKIQSVVSETPRLFSVAGSPRFEVYGIDFGWGRPEKVDVTSVDKTGAFSLSESRDHSGGIQIGLALTKNQMEAFSRVFAQGLESLES